MNDLQDQPQVTGQTAVGQWHGWRGDALALVATAAVFGLSYLLSPWVGDDPVLILFVIPILLSAYVGGLRAGLLCTGLVGAATAYVVLLPSKDFILERPLDVVQWLLLLLIGAT